MLAASAEHDDSRLALGFLAIGERDVVRLIYVKLAFRGMGIGLALLEAAQLPVPLIVEEAEPGWKRWAAYHKLPYVVSASRNHRLP